MLTHIFVINPKAGINKDIESFKEKIISTASELGVECEIILAASSAQSRQMIKDKCEAGGHLRFYACGGDGTTCDVLNSIGRYQGAELASVPIGSSNDFIRMFDDRKAFGDIALQMKSAAIPIDIVAVNDKLSLNIANVGIDADIAFNKDIFKPIPVIGKPQAYNLALVYTLLFQYGVKLKMEVDGENLDGDYILAAFANGKAYGNGYYVAPYADMTDGLMEFVAVKLVGRARVARCVGQLKNGKHLDDPTMQDIVIYRKTKEVIITADKPLKFGLDGEAYLAQNVKIKLLPGALKFVVPEGVNLS